MIISLIKEYKNTGNTYSLPFYQKNEQGEWDFEKVNLTDMQEYVKVKLPKNVQLVENVDGLPMLELPWGECVMGYSFACGKDDVPYIISEWGWMTDKESGKQKRLPPLNCMLVD